MVREETPAFERDPRIVLLGAPVDAGAGRRGAVMGPAALRVAGLPEDLRSLGYRVEDRGDLRPIDPTPEDRPDAHRIGEIAGWVRAIRTETAAVLAEGAMPVLLGGDHSIAMGSVDAVACHAAAKGRKLFVLWLDAHADFNTPETSPSGNVHGMSLAELCGEPGFAAIGGMTERGKVSPERVHLFGIRQIDRGEEALLHERGVDVVDMPAIDKDGVAAHMRRILDRVEAEDGLLHVSFDVDFLDPSIAPAVGTAVPGGASYREAHLIMEMLHESGRVVALDIVELNPFLDERGKSALLLVELVGSLFGRRIYDRGAARRRRTDA